MAEKLEERFSVDSALLRELGEQLVGAPYVALAELIKNSYDADATNVEIKFGEDRIDVSDDGHGMDHAEFRARWMRVGSPHKAEDVLSRRLHRPLTGSKGVGRLAVQFLGRHLEMVTTSTNDPDEQLAATIDWDEAVQAGELTNATALYEIGPSEATYAGGSNLGTRISIEGLRQTWENSFFEKLAREIWFLRPPFSDGLGRQVETEESFEVHLEADALAEEAFATQLRRVLDLWMARIRGGVTNSSDEPRQGTVKLLIEFQGGDRFLEEYQLPPSAEESVRLREDTDLDDLGPESLIEDCQFEIRVFDLRNKQRFGIRVKEAREYLNTYGGVHVYDSGFRIPFSGPEADWLGLEIAHSHRRDTTRFLPPDLRVDAAATFMPTNSRVFVAVHVDTSKERRAARRLATKRRDGKNLDHLQIQVSRDRLVRNLAFGQLRYIVTRALEHYATERAKRRIEEIASQRNVRLPSEAVDSALRVLALHEGEIPSEAYLALEAAIRNAVTDARRQAQLQQDLASQLAAFASAGSLALVYDHEVSKQIVGVERIAARLRSMDGGTPASAELEELASEIEDWAVRAQGIRSLVKHLSDPASHEASARYKLKTVLADASRGARYLTRGVPVELPELEDSVRLPKGLYAGWIALFQNLFVNAANAVLAEGGRGRIAVDHSVKGNRSAVRIQDSGIGVDLRKAESYFEPFERDLKVSAARRALAAGGTGLGLTLVRMIATDANTDVRFVEPGPGFATAVELRWEEIL